MTAGAWRPALRLGLPGLALVWATAAVLALPPRGGPVAVADRLSRGETFRPEALGAAADRLEGLLDGTCDLRFHTGALFVTVSAAELARGQADLALIDRRLGVARRSVMRALACHPSHAYAWLVLFWIDSVGAGYGPELLRFLEQSYRTGPRETWVAVRRNPIAMTMFEALPPALRERAVTEFLDLVQAAQLEIAARLFASLPADLQQRIVPRLAEVPFGLRRGFARWLDRLGLEVTVPGIPPRQEPPWRRGERRAGALRSLD